MKPLNNWLLIQPISDDTADNAEGALIILPDSAKHPPECGVVLAIGPKVKEVAIGNRVSFSRYRLESMDVRGEKRYMVREGDVVGVVE